MNIDPPASLSESLPEIQEYTQKLQLNIAALQKEIAKLQRKNAELEATNFSISEKNKSYQKREKGRSSTHDMLSSPKAISALIGHSVLPEVEKHGGWDRYQELAPELAKNYTPEDEESEQ